MPELPPLPPGFTIDQGGPSRPVTVGTPRPRKKEIREVGGSLGVVDPETGGFTPTYTPPPKVASANDQKAAAKRASLDSLVAQINRVEELYRGGLKDEAYGILSSIGDYLPTPGNRQFNAAAAGLAEQGLSAFRVPGVGAQSDAELRQFVQANRPSASNFDTEIEEKLRQLRVRVEATRSSLGLPPAQWLAPEGEAPAAVGDDNAVPPALDPAGDSPTQSPQLSTIYEGANGEGGGAVGQAATYQTVDDPALTGLKGEYLRRLGSGESAGAIIKWARDAGVPLDAPFVRSVTEQVSFRRQHPDVKLGNYDVSAFDDRYVPTTATQQAMTAAANTVPGATAIRAGNAVTMNNLDSIVGLTGGNAEQARIAIDDAGRQHPTAALVGDIGGGVSAAMLGEAGLARLGMASGVGRSLLADTSYGAAAGAGAADDGNRVSGAITGGLAGLAGSTVGQAGAKVIGSAASPTGGRLADLYESGVRPTFGQRAAAANDGRGVRGTVGRIVSTTEEGIGSIPIIGAGVRGARQESRDQFQIGAYNKALEPLGQRLPDKMRPGTAPYAFTKRVFDKSYDEARAGMQILPDDELVADVAKVRDRVADLEEPSIRRFENIVQNKLLRRSGAAMNGNDFKAVQSDLGRIVRGIRKSPKGDGELADSLEELSGILDSAARRHSDPAAVKLLDDTDRGYAMFVRIRDAAKSRGGAAAEFTPNQLDRAVQRNTAGRHSDAYLRGEALLQDYSQQGMSLADRLPNSGAADRFMVGAGATGVAGGLQAVEPHTLGVLGILGTLYAPGVRKGMQAAMSPRGPTMRAVGDAIRKRKRLAGATGATVAVQGTFADQ